MNVLELIELIEEHPELEWYWEESKVQKVPH